MVYGVTPPEPGGRPSRPSERIDEACDRFEAAWRTGPPPRIEDFLAGAVEADHRALLGELVALERELRRRRGERPGAQEYLDRFPAHAGLVRAAFGTTPGPGGGAAAQPQGDTGRNLLFGILALQNNFIGRDELLAGFATWVADKSRPLDQLLVNRGALDEARRGLLEALVAEHLKQHGGDTEASLAAVSSLGSVRDDLERLDDTGLQASLSAAASRSAGAGGDAEAMAAHTSSSRRVGERFRILRFHREGGLGRVYLARDEELGREVALKEIRPDMVAKADLRGRFVLEAQINGGLEHPGIVPVYSLGTYDDGRPFYAMRFVEGDSLKEAIKSYHDKHPRPDPTAVEFRKLLGRFVDVCEAIAFAHSRGVLHRDLKPHNVMLGRFGETLLIDWGLAKATGRREPVSLDAHREATLVPPSGGGHAPTLGVLGSPPYMSPEQAAGEVESLGPATDVYGLGAILFALLTGAPPVEGKTTEEILDRVRRGAIRWPRSLNPNTPKALEAVCLKALAPKPGDRYRTAVALAEEIEHWLADEPVMARPDPLFTRGWRWIRKHRTLATTAAAIAVFGGSVLAVAYRREVNYSADLARATSTAEAALTESTNAKKATERALEQSEDSRKRAEAVLAFLKHDVLAATRPEGQHGGLGKDVSVRNALDAAEPRIAMAFQEQPTVEAEVRGTLGATYLYLGDFLLAIRQFDRALELRRMKLGPDHPDTLESRKNLANAYRAAGRTAEAIELHQETLKLLESKLGRDHPNTLDSRNGLAAAYLSASRFSEAIALDEVTLKLRESRLGPDHPDMLPNLNNLATAYWYVGRTVEAITILELTLKLRESKLSPDHPDTLITRNNLANAYRAVGRTAEAVKMHEDTLNRQESKLGALHRETLISRMNLAAAYGSAGRTVEALKMNETTLTLFESRFGPDHPDTLGSRNNLATDYESLGRWSGAERLRRRNALARRKAEKPDSPALAGDLAALGYNLLEQSRWSEAESLFRECLAIRQKGLPHHWRTFNTRSQLGGSLLGQKRYAEAEPLILAGYEGIKASQAVIPASSQPRLLEAAERVIQLYTGWGKPARAADWKLKLGLADLPDDLFAGP